MVITEGSINFQGTTRGSMVIVTKIYLQPTGTLQPFTECIFLGPGSPQRSVKERTLAKLGQQFGSWDGMAVDLFDILKQLAIHFFWYHDFELHQYADILGSRL